MKLRQLAMLSAIALLPAATQAADIFASDTHWLIRGSIAGDFPGWYGGDLLATFPVAMTEAEARAAVVGAPDNVFVSLPGVTGTPAGSPFPGAYVEVSFGANFGADQTLKLWELGDNQESAHIFLWGVNGSNVQFTFTRGASDLTAFDLSAFAADMAFLGGAFAKVGIGGLDLNGTSQGFDLDAVAITAAAAVPEPSTYALMLAGLGMVGWVGRRQRRNG